jgi:GIY-YIG catalytic domain
MSAARVACAHRRTVWSYDLFLHVRLPHMQHYTHRLLHLDRLYTASDVAARPCPLPARPGLYAWYFNEPPPHVDTTACHRLDGQCLLYVGISPQAPPANGRRPSSSTLRKRIRTHYFGNASASTLRRTLGCLLTAPLSIQLRRVGSSGRYTFTNPGERQLGQWMARHAFVTWLEVEAPWELERHLLSSGLSLPLNVDGNPCREAVAAVSAVRLRARQLADQLEVIVDSGGPRRVLGRGP